MAHELDFSTGDAAYVEYGGRVTAWHRHGRTIRPEEFQGLTGRQKVQRILEAGRLDWDVEPFDVFDEAHHLVKGWKAYRRTDNDHLMGVFKESYTILQNHELFALVEPLLDTGVIEFETAGALREGEDVWGLFRFNPKDPGVAEYFGAEGIIPFALLSNNHSYKRLATIAETPIRVVCANTLSMAHGALPHRGKRAGRYPGAVQLRHTRNIHALSVDAVEHLWGQITRRYAAIAASYEAMKRRYLTADEFEVSVLDVLAPLPQDPDSKQYDSTLQRANARRYAVTRLYQGEGRGLNGEPTAWNAYNAAVEAVDWDAEAFPVRSTDRLSGIYPGGSLANKKQDVLNALHALSV